MTALKGKTPFVSFVGAGPGNPDLLTLRAMRRLKEAEIVLHDALGTREILDLLPAPVRRVNVGKRAGRHAIPQEEINLLLVNLALRGRRVVRLKGGDPAIFGRLEEEVAALADAGIPYEIVPGITAASAAVASVGLSLTMRGVARRVQFVTGHTRQDEAFDPVASGIGDPGVTSVVYMARGAAAGIGAGLINAGWPGTTPVLVLASVSQPNEIHIWASLNRLAHAVAALPADAPLVLVLGNAVAASKLRREAVAGAAHELRLRSQEFTFREDVDPGI
ncbi:uroporphyrinogen-III C-methyltransferase [Parvibaculum sp.]|jgi:uroporphyrin-III C-methyltransferase|uniref:uroporphyrinogen-III C-methyltransferase n=1 Tax=Parvibaculum sp. TaxID=2024848 RepID=UPI000C4474A7|nr:uroporphyrinogen-III C-methyltransferase [Parvibaculum sp.]MAM95240.1 uroporphyrinogen-III C-methyltransferase [Parvibaculum sp.]|tara:strand:+ start:277 stop:1107 length:831 start_codon:yes stop_codon:yes gene_type:complete